MIWLLKDKKNIQDKFYNLKLDDFNLTRTDSRMIGYNLCLPSFKILSKKKQIYDYQIFSILDMKNSTKKDLGDNFHEIIKKANRWDGFRLFFNYRGKYCCISKGQPMFFKYYDKTGEVTKDQFLNGYKQQHVPSVLHSDTVAKNKISQIRHYTSGYSLKQFKVVDIQTCTVETVSYTNDELKHFCQILEPTGKCFNNFFLSRNQETIQAETLSVLDLLSMSHDVDKPTTFFVGTKKGYVVYTSNSKSVNTDFYFINHKGSFVDDDSFFSIYKKNCDYYKEALDIQVHDVPLSKFHEMVVDKLNLELNDVNMALSYNQKPRKHSSFNAMKVILSYFYDKYGLPLFVKKPGKRKHKSLIKYFEDKLEGDVVKWEPLNFRDCVNIAKIQIYRNKLNELLLRSKDTGIKKELVIEEAHYGTRTLEKDVYIKNEKFIHNVNMFLKRKASTKERRYVCEQLEVTMNYGRDLPQERIKECKKLFSRFDFPIEEEPYTIKKTYSTERWLIPAKTCKVKTINYKLKNELLFREKNKFEELYLNDDEDDYNFEYEIDEYGVLFFNYKGERGKIETRSKIDKELQKKFHNQKGKKTQKTMKKKKAAGKWQMAGVDHNSRMEKNALMLKSCDHKIQTIDSTVAKIATWNNIFNMEKVKLKKADFMGHISKKDTNLTRKGRKKLLQRLGVPELLPVHNDFSLFLRERDYKIKLDKIEKFKKDRALKRIERGIREQERLDKSNALVKQKHIESVTYRNKRRNASRIIFRFMSRMLEGVRQKLYGNALKIQTAFKSYLLWKKWRAFVSVRLSHSLKFRRIDRAKAKLLRFFKSKLVLFRLKKALQKQGKEMIDQSAPEYKRAVNRLKRKMMFIGAKNGVDHEDYIIARKAYDNPLLLAGIPLSKLEEIYSRYK